jgi:hypothetical protein
MDRRCGTGYEARNAKEKLAMSFKLRGPRSSNNHVTTVTLCLVKSISIAATLKSALGVLASIIAATVDAKRNSVSWKRHRDFENPRLPRLFALFTKG